MPVTVKHTPCHLSVGLECSYKYTKYAIITAQETHRTARQLLWRESRPGRAMTLPRGKEPQGLVVQALVMPRTLPLRSLDRRDDFRPFAQGHASQCRHTEHKYQVSAVLQHRSTGRMPGPVWYSILSFDGPKVTCIPCKPAQYYAEAMMRGGEGGGGGTGQMLDSHPLRFWSGTNNEAPLGWN